MPQRSINGCVLLFLEHYHHVVVMELLGVMDSISDAAVLQHRRCVGRRVDTNERSI